MSKLKIYDLQRIEMMTLREFNYRMYALEYEQLDKDMDMYKLAFAIRDAQAEQKNVVAKREKLSIVLKVLTTLWTTKKTSNVLIEENLSNLVQTPNKKLMHHLICSK